MVEYVCISRISSNHMGWTSNSRTCNKFNCLVFISDSEWKWLDVVFGWEMNENKQIISMYVHILTIFSNASSLLALQKEITEVTKWFAFYYVCHYMLIMIVLSSWNMSISS